MSVKDGDGFDAEKPDKLVAHFENTYAKEAENGSCFALAEVKTISTPAFVCAVGFARRARICVSEMQENITP